MLPIRAMARSDLPAGIRLREQAGWNQTEADLARVFEMNPEGCFVAELDGVVRGTTCTTIFGSVAWISMVLVDPAVRRRGIGSALMEHALDFLDRQSVRAVRLDATPLGQPVYQRLGFFAQYELARFEGMAAASMTVGPRCDCPTLPSGEDIGPIRPIRPDDLDDLIRLDTEVTGTDRTALLARLFREQPEEMRSLRRDGRLLGFVTARCGARATQIGPCIAQPEAGPLLLADAWDRRAGQRVYVDVPLTNQPAMDFARQQGLTVQRPFVRMCRGERVDDRTELLWASFGPEKG